jgi:KUP system potassium uptake protein
MEVRHTSGETIGQIYMPAINWLLMVSVVALVLGFKSSANLGAAYGIAVTGTMVITAVLEFVVIRHLWRWSLWRALPVIVVFLTIDLAFFAANAIKIEDGGWFPLVFGLFILLTTWRRGRRLFAERVQEEAIDLDQFIAGVKEFPPQRVPGTAVFMTPNPKRVPFALLHSMKHYKVLHERIVMLTVEVMDVPHVADANRVAVEHLGDEFHRVKVFFGFMDDTDLPRALEWCAEGGLDFDLMDTTFFLGRETLIPTLGKDMAYWRELLFVALFRNATTATAFFRIPANRVVELGSQVIL